MSSTAQVNPVPVLQLHNPGPTFQQTEQVQHFGQVGLNPTTADNQVQALSSTTQVNPVPVLQQKEHTQQFNRTRLSSATANGYTQAIPSIADGYAQDFLPLNQVQYSSAQVKRAKGSNIAPEELRTDLKACGIPQQDWKYYLLEPQGL